MGCWMVFVVYAMRWLAHFYHSLTPSFFHRECGDVPLLCCPALPHIKHVYGLSHEQTRLITRAKASIVFNSFFTVMATFLS
jgi:phenylalanine-4-hydroxylase